MKLYTPIVLEGQEWVVPRQEDNLEWLWALHGNQQLAAWHPPRVDFLRARENGFPLEYSDFPWLTGGVLILRARALQVLGPTLGDYGEVLPLVCDEPVSLLNVTTLIDALDNEASRVACFDDGSILEVEKYVFRPEAIGEAQLFRLPADVLRQSPIYLQEPLVRRIGESGLSGVAFDLVWMDETAPMENTRIEYSSEASPVAHPSGQAL